MRLKLSQPNWVGVGAWAKLGKITFSPVGSFFSQNQLYKVKLIFIPKRSSKTIEQKKYCQIDFSIRGGLFQVKNTFVQLSKCTKSFKRKNLAKMTNLFQKYWNKHLVCNFRIKANDKIWTKQHLLDLQFAWNNTKVRNKHSMRNIRDYCLLVFSIVIYFINQEIYF